MDRAALGELWLRWYVLRSDRTKPVRDIQAQHAEALQLRVSDMDDPAVWAALGEADPAQPEHSHLARILEYQERFEGIDAAAIVLPAWMSPEGPVIIDGAHRACAIYRLEPVVLEVDVLLLGAPPGHPDLLPGLRVLNRLELLRARSRVKGGRREPTDSRSRHLERPRAEVTKASRVRGQPAAVTADSALPRSSARST